jgi:Leucine-rich repeat (LRR) protein
MNRIRILYLSDNRLSAVPTQIFKHMPSIQVLNLARNSIHSVASGDFQVCRIHQLFYRSYCTAVACVKRNVIIYKQLLGHCCSSYYTIISKCFLSGNLAYYECVCSKTGSYEKRLSFTLWSYIQSFASTNEIKVLWNYFSSAKKQIN